MPPWVESLPLTGDMDSDLDLLFRAFKEEMVDGMEEALDWFSFIFGEERGWKKMEEELGITDEEAQEFWERVTNERQRDFVESVLSSWATDFESKDLAKCLLALLRKGAVSLAIEGEKRKVGFKPIVNNEELVAKTLIPMFLGALGVCFMAPWPPPKNKREAEALQKMLEGISDLSLQEEEPLFFYPMESILREWERGWERELKKLVLLAFRFPEEEKALNKLSEVLSNTIYYGEKGKGDPDIDNNPLHDVDIDEPLLFSFDEFPSFFVFGPPQSAEEARGWVNFLALLSIASLKREEWREGEVNLLFSVPEWGLFSTDPRRKGYLNASTILPHSLEKEMKAAWKAVLRMCEREEVLPLDIGGALRALSYREVMEGLLAHERDCVLRTAFSPCFMESVGREDKEKETWRKIREMCGEHKALSPAALVAILRRREEGLLLSQTPDPEKTSLEVRKTIQKSERRRENLKERWLFTSEGFKKAWETWRGDLKGFLSLINEAMAFEEEALRAKKTTGGDARLPLNKLWIRLANEALSGGEGGGKGIEEIKEELRRLRALIAKPSLFPSEERLRFVPQELKEEERLWAEHFGAEKALLTGAENLKAWERSVEEALKGDWEEGNPCMFLRGQIGFGSPKNGMEAPSWFEKTRKAAICSVFSGEGEKRKPSLFFDEKGVPVGFGAEKKGSLQREEACAEEHRCPPFFPWISFLGQMDHAAMVGFAKEMEKEGKDLKVYPPGAMYRHWGEYTRWSLPLPPYLKGEEEGRRFAVLHRNFLRKEGKEKGMRVTVLWRLAEAVPSLRALETALDLLGMHPERPQGEEDLEKVLAFLGRESMDASPPEEKKPYYEDFWEREEKSNIECSKIIRNPWSRWGSKKASFAECSINPRPTDDPKYWTKVEEALSSTPWRDFLSSCPQLRNLAFSCPDPLSLVEVAGEVEGPEFFETQTPKTRKLNLEALVSAHAFGALTSRTEKMTPKEKKALYAILRKAFSFQDTAMKRVKNVKDAERAAQRTIESLWWNSFAPHLSCWEAHLPRELGKKEAFRKARELIWTVRGMGEWFLSAVNEEILLSRGANDSYGLRKAGRQLSVAWWECAPLMGRNGLKMAPVGFGGEEERRRSALMRAKEVTEEVRERPWLLSRSFLQWVREATKGKIGGEKFPHNISRRSWRGWSTEAVQLVQCFLSFLVFSPLGGKNGLLNTKRVIGELGRIMDVEALV
ncbi:MAG: hypothetical protein QXH08_00290 [Candidatus Hadarchaeales archaeon]